MNRQQIKEIFLGSGFKERLEKLQERGLLLNVSDLSPHVYSAAAALLEAFVEEIKVALSENLIDVEGNAQEDPRNYDGDQDEAFNDGLSEAENIVIRLLAGTVMSLNQMHFKACNCPNVSACDGSCAPYVGNAVESDFDKARE